MDKGLLPRRYAKALYAVALDRGVATELYEHMKALHEAFVAEPGLAKTVANPFVEFADKEQLLLTAAGLKSGDKDKATFEDMLKLLEQNRRIDIVRELADAYCLLYRQEKNILRVEVSSAAPLNAAARKRLTDLIAEHLNGGTLELKETVDPRLIGGFTVRIENELLDASIKNELERLRLSLMK